MKCASVPGKIGTNRNLSGLASSERADACQPGRTGSNHDVVTVGAVLAVKGASAGDEGENWWTGPSEQLGGWKIVLVHLEALGHRVPMLSARLIEEFDCVANRDAA